MEASVDGGDLVVKSGDRTLTARDVVVGEVWLCSGQSNMEWRVDQANNAEQEIAAADFPLIRQFRVPKTYEETPQSEVKAQWAPASPKTVSNFSAVAYYFARDLHQTLKVPIGLINASFGGKMIETFMSPEAFAASGLEAPVMKRWNDEQARLPALMELWKKKNAGNTAAGGEGEEVAAPKGMNPSVVVAQHRPGCLFNAMLNPLIPYAIKGMIWYQGEHNIARAEEYQSLFPAFIKDMRQKMGQGDFPFYLVQLANYDAKLDKSREGYAKLREVQLNALKLPNTGMAVTIDIGTPENVHPKNKQDVGLRLARWAKAKTYDLGGVYSGPLFQSAERDGAAVRVKFDSVGGGLVAEKELGSFELAGGDGVFKPATAKIEGDTVIVQSEAVVEPQAVRYAWANAPVATLFNKEGLPASPFRFSF
jgi:sialate O-acetylesterase